MQKAAQQFYKKAADPVFRISVYPTAHARAVRPAAEITCEVEPIDAAQGRFPWVTALQKLKGGPRKSAGRKRRPC